MSELKRLPEAELVCPTTGDDCECKSDCLWFGQCWTELEGLYGKGEPLTIGQLKAKVADAEKRLAATQDKREGT